MGFAFLSFVFSPPACRKLGVKKSRRIRIVKGSVMVDLISGCYILDSVSHSLINNSLVARETSKECIDQLTVELN